MFWIRKIGKPTPGHMARSSIARTNHKIFVVSTMGLNIAKIARDSKKDWTGKQSADKL